MKPDHLDKIGAWFLEQMAAAESEKTGEQDLEEGALADLALRRVFGQHFEEIRYQRDLLEDTYAITSQRTSSSVLREVASQAREEGKSGLGYYLEAIADYRDGQPWKAFKG